jgi:superfamily II DNA or RNA helicase
MQFITYFSLHKANYNYDFVYLDECHNAKKKHGDWLRLYDGPILGLTGSYPKYKTSESFIVCDEFCPVVYKYEISDGIADHMLNDYRIFVHLLELNNKPSVRTKSGGLMSEQANYNMWTKFVDQEKNSNKKMLQRIMRMKAMQAYKTKVDYAKRLLSMQTEKTLVFTDYTDQADLICNHVYHSKEPRSKEYLDLFKSGKISKLSSVLQIAEGANIPNLKVGIIMHAYANEKKLKQKIGRFLRLNPNEKSIVHLLCYKNTIDFHWCKSALKDFENVFQRLNNGGIIIMHDTDPESDHLIDPGYCGDSYKIVRFLENRSDINCYTMPLTEAGLTIITKKNETRTARRNYM